MFTLSQKPPPETRLNIGGSYCAGGAGTVSVSPGPACAGWFATRTALKSGAVPLETAKTYSLETYVNNPGPGIPCAAPFDRKITDSVTVTP